jgi:hypothetical protein
MQQHDEDGNDQGSPKTGSSGGHGSDELASKDLLKKKK